MTVSSLPDWLTPSVFATNGPTVFVVDKAQKARPPAKGIVLTAANGDRFPLAQCHKATLTDLPKAQRFIDGHGFETVISVVDDLVLLSAPGTTDIRRVRLSGLRDAVSVFAIAQSFAADFNGVIVEDCDEDFI